MTRHGKWREAPVAGLFGHEPPLLLRPRGEARGQTGRAQLYREVRIVMRLLRGEFLPNV